MHLPCFTRPPRRIAPGVRACAALSVAALSAAAAAVGSGCLAIDDSPSAADLASAPAALDSETSSPLLDLGDQSGCAVLLDGALWCWGANSAGQLGDGTTTTRTAPIHVDGIEGILEVAAAANHTCALDYANRVWCWGNNAGGRLGDGTRINHYTPGLAAVSDAFHVATGYDHSCAVLATGEVMCWGSNLHRQLGSGSNAIDSPTPVQVAGMEDARSVTAGAYFSCAVRADGAVLCWGENASGQLGDGTTQTRNQAVAVAGLTDAVAVAAGTNHACALRAGGDVQCWGSNTYGQLGVGATGGGSATPVAVVGLADVAELAAATMHTCAVTTAGAMSCWGANGSFQLGDGTTTARPAPVAAAGIDDALHVGAGAYASCVSRASGAVVCWGADAAGQLGDGGPTSVPPSPTPVTVALP